VSDDPTYMRAALAEAAAGAIAGELPIGAVIVVDGEIVARGRSRQVERGTRIAHAETDAITTGGMRLVHDAGRATIYTTVEPCPMCLGAIVMAGIPDVVFAARDRNAGVPEVIEASPYVRRHVRSYRGGLLEGESRALIGRHVPDLLRYLDGAAG
jgi:tRNA(adenine34) deaminase